MKICDNNLCTGCGACCNICTHECITMIQDSNGFRRPAINDANCINCGMCQRYCPVNHNNETKKNPNETPTPYAYINPKTDVIKDSSSGGAFSAFAEYIISLGGAVFGAAYDCDFHVEHECITSTDSLARLRGSKYVESDLKDSFTQVKSYLDKCIPVLFTGTPCQIAGLYASLHYKEYGNLYTMELLCHGVPSAKVFDEYITWLQKTKGKITSYSFRDKSKWGWGNWGSYSYIDHNSGKMKKVLFPVVSDYYYSLYFKENNFRESCYRCPYANLERAADITVGDFWGIEKVNPNLPSQNGVSVITVNTKKGSNLFKMSKCADNSIPVKIDDVIRFNPTITRATVRPESRNNFYVQFNRLGFEKTARIYCKLHYVFPIISRYIPRKLKAVIKRVIG